LVLLSRPVATWLNAGASFAEGAADGTPLDRTLLMFLMFIAAIVLMQRKANWTLWLARNPWIFLFVLYCGVSILWSDFPSIGLKRWFRALGSVMMILVVLSEKEPATAVAALIRRSAYILVPFSLLLIKYYRHMGVGYNIWSGEEYLIGVTTDKNALGRLCLISGVFILWELTRARDKVQLAGKLDRMLTMVMFGLTMMLLSRSKSSTSLASFLAGSAILLVLGVPMVQRNVRSIVAIGVVGAVLTLVLAPALNLVELVVTSLGRDMTLTDRTFVWGDLIGLGTNPLVGVGYDTFWLGERLETFMRVHQVNSAHNGYLEVYIELGIIGLLLLAAVLVSSSWKAMGFLTADPDYGRLRLALLVMFLLYNVTESGYKLTTGIAFVFLLVTMDYSDAPQMGRAQVLPSSRFRPLQVADHVVDSGAGRVRGPRPAAVSRWHATIRRSS
jgi:O-antigen ligase